MSAGLHDYFRLACDEIEASHRAPLSLRRAISAAVMLNVLPDRIFEAYRFNDPYKVWHAQDVPEYRARLEAECGDLAILHAMCRFEEGAPKLERKIVSVDDDESKKLALGDFMISLYNGLSVHAILVHMPNGKELRFDALMDRAAAWWKNEFEKRGLREMATESNVQVKTRAGSCFAHIYKPAGQGPWPGVIMLTDINGLRPAFYGMAARMADLGYVVLLPDIYHRSGQFPHFDHVPSSRDPNDRPKILEMGALMTAPAQLEDGGAWVDYLTALPDVKGKIGVVGYCLTGPSAVYTAAARPDKVGAAATFHGVKLATEAPDSPHTFLPKIKAAVYFGHATNDQTCPPEMIAKLEAEMKKVGTKGESVTYPSNHGFAVNGSPNYDEASSEKHWAVLTKLFKENL